LIIICPASAPATMESDESPEKNAVFHTSLANVVTLRDDFSDTRDMTKKADSYLAYRPSALHVCFYIPNCIFGEIQFT